MFPQAFLFIQAGTVADLPESEDTIIGTDRGLWRLDSTGDIQAVANASADEFGAVRKMAPVP